MDIHEIFSKLATHAIEGMMTHENFANYYDFLGLKGYKKCHEYHFIDEMCGYRQICKYYINHYDKIIPKISFSEPPIIPDTWYNHVRQDVDNATLQSAVKDGLSKWEKWEESTKELYEQLYIEAMNIGEVAAANFINSFVEDVDCELKKVKRYMLEKKATNYNISDIIMEQHKKHDKYDEKLHTIMYR